MSVDGGRSRVAAVERSDHSRPAVVVEAPTLLVRRARDREAADVTAPLKLLALVLRRDVGARVRLRPTLEAGAVWPGEVRLFAEDGDEPATDASSGTLTSFSSFCVSFSSEETGMCDIGVGEVCALFLRAICGSRVDDFLLEGR